MKTIESGWLFIQSTRNKLTFTLNRQVIVYGMMLHHHPQHTSSQLTPDGHELQVDWVMVLFDWLQIFHTNCETIDPGILDTKENEIRMIHRSSLPESRRTTNQVEPTSIQDEIAFPSGLTFLGLFLSFLCRPVIRSVGVW